MRPRRLVVFGVPKNRIRLGTVPLKFIFDWMATKIQAWYNDYVVVYLLSIFLGTLVLESRLAVIRKVIHIVPPF